MITKYALIFGILFLIINRLHSVNRRNFEDFFGEDAGRIASYFRWDTEKADKFVNKNFGSSDKLTASVTSGWSLNRLNSDPRPEVFSKLSYNQNQLDEKFNQYEKHRFGSLKTEIKEKMGPVKHVKLNKKIKKCKAEAKRIGGKKGKELFLACKAEYNKRLQKTNTEKYIGKKIKGKITPSVANKYLKKNIGTSKRNFIKKRLKYLDGKDSKILFKEGFNNRYQNFKIQKSKFLKKKGKIFKVTLLIVFVSFMMFYIYDTFQYSKTKFKSLSEAKRM